MRIKPSIDDPLNPILPSILETVEKALESMIPSEFWSQFDALEDPEEMTALLYRFTKQLPLFSYSIPASTPSTLIVTYLCSGEYINGAGRYILDMLDKWLVPGKYLEPLANTSLNFRFLKGSFHRFYLGQEVLTLSDPLELESVRQNIDSLIQEIKLNLLAVYHARYIASLKNATEEQKKLLIQKHLSSFFEDSDQPANSSIYDRMQAFLAKLSEQEKLKKVKQNISLLSRSRPKLFPREIFEEMGYFKAAFNETFIAQREPNHITRLIAYQYLFKKTLQSAHSKGNKTNRSLSLKFLRTKVGSSPKQVLGILLAVTLLRETERIEKRHLVEAIRTCLPDFSVIPESYLVDRRDSQIHFFYLEIDPLQFTSYNLRLLREKLPFELDRRVEAILHPTFMPRNEEELLRHTVELSRQLKHARDLPQTMIHFEKQTDRHLSFTVIVVRVLTFNTPPIRDAIANTSLSSHFDVEDIRVVGRLKQRYEKEAVVLRATLDKTSFFRKDHSVDLLRARQEIASDLIRLLGEVRDYNGGMILKQEEAFISLRKIIGSLNKDKEFLLENYFHSLRPGIMQTVHDPHILQHHFQMLLDLLQEESPSDPYLWKSTRKDPYLFLFICAPSPALRDRISSTLQKLKIHSSQLTTSFLQIQNKTIFGFIYRFEHLSQKNQFEEAIYENLSNSNRSFG